MQIHINNKTHDKKIVNIYFDKECPFCKTYVNYVKLKNQYTLHFFDARVSLFKLDTLRKKGFDINDGIIVEIDGMIFQGSTALECLNDLSARKNMYMSTKFFKRFIYPLLLRIRKLWFFMLNKDAHI